MRRSYHPALVLMALGALSGTLGTSFLDFNIGEAPQPGIYMVLTGLWFGLVVAFGLWRWGNSLPAALVTAVGATWLGWELAVNLALQFEQPWYKATSLPEGAKSYISGFLAGAVGAFTTWAGAASFTQPLRQPVVALAVTGVGALFGLLLPMTNSYDHPVILLLPWQAAVAAMLGFWLAPETELDRAVAMGPASGE